MSPRFTVGDNLIGNHTARLVEFKEETYTRGEHETRLCENRMRGEGELHTKAEQRISTIEQEDSGEVGEHSTKGSVAHGE